MLAMHFFHPTDCLRALMGSALDAHYDRMSSSHAFDARIYFPKVPRVQISEHLRLRDCRTRTEMGMNDCDDFLELVCPFGHGSQTTFHISPG